MSSIDEKIKAFNDDATVAGEDDATAAESCFNTVVTQRTSESYEYRCFGNRFQVNIPKHATIHAVYWEGYIYTTTLDNIACDIYGHLIGNAPDFSSFSEGGTPYVWKRPRTIASVEWVEDNLGVGWHRSPELQTIIQELVNQDDWAANNHLVLLFIAKVQETVKRAVFHSWNYALEGPYVHATKLHIEYSAPPTKVDGLAAENITDRSFKLSWNENPAVEAANLYRVYLSKI
ncbi:unnamed protein product [marine sediment metagenome]|uniref:Uncharacterized protein n=1 Tax=marine sediment metagenome TaxID=412755 RepID=X1DYN6_9ZZZZ